MKVLIMGGSGLIGTKLVKTLRERGHEAVPASPSLGVDSVTGAGLTEAMQGTNVVVDVTNAPSWENTAVLRFFETSTRNLLRAAADARVGHYVALSVVGIDRLPDAGYMRAKVAQEALIRSSKLTYTIIRATQFFEFIGAIAEAGGDGDAVRLPAAHMQPIAAADVSAALADVVVAASLNGMVELAGPERLPMAELVRRFFVANGDPRHVIVDERAGYYGMNVDDRSLTPGDRPLIGATRFAQWLAEHFHPAQVGQE